MNVKVTTPEPSRSVIYRDRLFAWLAVFAAVSGLNACAFLTPSASSSQGSSAASSTDAASRSVSSMPTSGPDCRPLPDADRPQYIIGYGSLMQDESRKRTTPQSGPAHPVEVVGYRRGWFAKGDPQGFSTTFLGALPEPRGLVNAVIYRVEPGELAETDRRESSYCRENVPLSAIKTLEIGPFQIPAGQVWIYVNGLQTIATPSTRYPIVQSYVDIFLSGCLEQERRFAVKGFAQSCLTTTSDWSEHWVNDRLLPRRPFIHQPSARQIDTLISENLPTFYSRIRIE